MVTLLILLVAIAVLGWGFIRARPYGNLGILAWLQSVALMAPWLIFFGLFAAGIYINVVVVLLLLLVSTGAYVYIGRQLRRLGKDELMAQRASAFASSAEESATDQPTTDQPTAEQKTTETGSETTAADPTKTDGTTDDADQKPAVESLEPLFTPMPAEDLQAVEGVFGVDTFFRVETIPYQDGAIFKGNLRSTPDEAQAKLTEALEARLGDRYRLFLVENPDGKPVAIVLPSASDPQPLTPVQKGIAGVLALATLATSLETGGILLGFDFFESPERWPEVLPIALGVVATLAAHEIGHWVLARRHQVKLSLPFFIPAWQIGSFGALTRFASLVPNRSVLFDVAYAGPAAGGLLSLGLLLVGLVLSHPGSAFQVPTEFFQGSLLVGALARVVLGDGLQQALVDVHPLTLIGWLGLVITALNLMPAGQLDGGRVVQAIYGRKVARRATVITLIVLAVVSLANPLALYWAVLILVLQRGQERPSLNELTEPDDARAALGLLALFLMLATLVPLTPSLAGKLGIGA